jgi:hypothetical protein
VQYGPSHWRNEYTDGVQKRMLELKGKEKQKNGETNLKSIVIISSMER